MIAKRLGATHVINYRTTPEWANEALRFTQGTGIDHVFDVGGAGTIEQSLQATRQAGQVTVVGILTESRPADLIPAILFGNKQSKSHSTSFRSILLTTAFSFWTARCRQQSDVPENG